MKRGFRAMRMRSDALKIKDEWTNREMTYMGKDYGDVERMVDLIKWMGIEFHDYWQDECNADLKRMGMKV